MNPQPPETGTPSPTPDARDHVAPPVRPGQLGRTTSPTTWPITIGIICIVMGGIGVAMYGWGVIAPFLMPDWKWLGRVSGAGTTEAIGIWKIPLAIMDGLVCLVTVLLVLGGIELCRRRARGAKGIFVWAVLKLLLTIPLVILTAAMQQDQFKAMGASGQMPAMPPAMTVAMVVGTAIFSAIWYALLPTFLVIWFTRPGIKKEVASWRPQPVS